MSSQDLVEILRDPGFYAAVIVISFALWGVVAGIAYLVRHRRKRQRMRRYWESVSGASTSTRRISQPPAAPQVQEPAAPRSAPSADTTATDTEAVRTGRRFVRPSHQRFRVSRASRRAVAHDESQH